MNDKMELNEAIKELESLSPSETAIETVLQALKEQDNEIVKYQLYLTENSIPKKKIEDEIKEIHKIISQLKDEYIIHQDDYIKNKLDSIENVLQELLENN